MSYLGWRDNIWERSYAKAVIKLSSIMNVKKLKCDTEFANARGTKKINGQRMLPVFLL